MKNISRRCGLSALVMLLCLWALVGVGLGTPGGPVPPPDCPPCPDCTHCGGAAANWQCVTNCNICEFECPCREYCQDPEGPNGTNNCQKCDLNLGCVGCDHWDDCEDCNRLVIPGGECQSFCDPEDDCCHGQCCSYVQCRKCNNDPNYYQCVSRCDPNETCCYGKCCNTKQCLECNGDPDDPNCRDKCTLNPAECLECDGKGNCVSKCDPNACESCYGAEGCKDRCVRDHPDECLECDGKGNCVSECDPNACELCYGAEGCDDQCTRNPDDCLKCDGEGSCICDAEIESVSASKDYVCVNENVTFTADVDSRCDCVEWSGGGDPATADGTCSFTTKWATAGVKSVTAASPCSSGGESVTVVAVGAIEINYAAGSWDDVTGETIVVLMGTKYTFRAMPNPAGASWPSGSPVWSGAASGTGATIEVTFGSEGTETLTAKCGCCEDGKTVTIDVIKPVVDAITYGGGNHQIYNVSSPEYLRNPPRNEPACWTINSAAEADVSFWHEQSLSYVTDSIVVRAEIEGDYVDIGDRGDSAASTFGTSWPSADITCAMEWICDVIHLHNYDAQWKYKVTTGTNQWIDTTLQSGCRLYTVLDTPQAPQSQPWKEVLDLACGSIAWNSASKPDAVFSIWYNFYWDAGGVYDTENGAPQYAFQSQNGKFDLSLWLANYPSLGQVNCHDMGQAVVVFANALGCNAFWTYVNPFGYLNCIKPIGCGWTNNPFYGNDDYDDLPITGEDDCDDLIPNNHAGRSGFGNHSFSRLGDNIYDASVGCVDIDVDPDDGPGHTSWYLDGSDSWVNNYDDRVIDDVPSVNTGPLSNYSFDVE